MMLDDPKATAETYGFHTAGWNVGAGRSAATVSRIAPMLGVAPDKNREPNMAEVLPFVHETNGISIRCACATSRTSIAIPK